MDHAARKETPRRKKSKIAERARKINIALFALILVMIAIAAALVLNNTNDINSRQTARSWSAEAAEKFYSYISRDLVLVQKAARSRAVTDWFDDETNPGKKTAAYNEMLDYIGMLQNPLLCFGIEKGTRHQYFIHGRVPFEEFKPNERAVLDPANPVDAWYFECLNPRNTNEYTLNIDIAEGSDKWQLWINHKVYKYGSVTGVFCSGLNIEPVLSGMFGFYDNKSVNGYLINNKGVIMMDSAFSGGYGTRNIQNEAGDPVFASVMTNYLAGIKGIFGREEQPEVVKLSGGRHKYAAIAPITGTNWSAVVFINKNQILNSGNLLSILPLPLILLFAFFLYAMGQNAIMNRLIFTPLHLLTQSITKYSGGNSVFFGSDRDDEIGELSRTIRDAAMEEHRLTQNYSATAAKLDAVIANYSGVIWSVDKDNVITLFRGLYLDVIGVKPAFLEGKSIELARLKNRHLDIIDNIKKTYSEGPQDWISNIDGKQFRVRTTAIRDENGNNAGVVGNVDDVTRIIQLQKELESALEKANNAVHALESAQLTVSSMFNANPHINILFNSKFEVVDFNPAAMEFMGFSTEKEMREGFTARLSKGIPEFQADGRPSVPIAERLMTAVKDGSVKFETEISMGGVKRNLNVEFKKIPYENSFAIVAYVFDMTDIHKRELELMCSREQNELQLQKVKLAARASKIGFWDIEIADNDAFSPLNVFRWSDELRNLLGFSGEEDFPNLFSSWSSRLHPDDRENVYAKFEKHLLDRTGRTPYNVEYRLLKKDGEYAYFRDTGETTRDENGNAIRVAGAILDITEIKNILLETEKHRLDAETANKAKSAFLSTMSHEIRTPMNAILGVTEILLQKDDLDQGMREALDKIYVSGDLLLGIINDILDLSKIEAGKLELLINKYEIVSLISDTAQLNMMRIGSKPIEFELDVDEALPQYLLGDELRVKQILNNILSNAFKYTAAGTVKLSVSQEAEEGEKSGDITLILRVSDTGQGMTKEQVGALFDEYTRFNLEANRSTEGTGLGMSITRNLIRLMKGAIFIESEPGKGSVFTVRLPQGRAGSEVLGRELAENLHQFRSSSRAQMRRVQIAREPMPYGSVLIVDDVETNIYVARGLLVPYGLKIESADSGYTAIEKIKNGSVYDIVFMDHMMPKMDGVEAAKIIRGMGYTKPIVALTANAVSGQADIFLGNGFDDFISKPIDIRQMNAVLNKFIRDRQPPGVIEAARKETGSQNGQSAESETRKALDPRFAEIFARDASKSILALEQVNIKTGECGEDDLRTYIIHVHGIKSALANIGKMELSALALKLEMSARDGDTELIASETPAFLDSLRRLVEEIKPKTGNANTADEDKAYLRENLLAIKSACENYDEKKAESGIAGLRQKTWSEQTKELISTIEENLLHSDFDEAAAEIDKYLGA